jgi:hypothetical protein
MPMDFKAFRQKSRNLEPPAQFALILNHHHLILATTFFIDRTGIK